MQARSVIGILATFAALFPTQSLPAQGTAFSYQGRLNEGANPAHGIYDLRFTIHDSANAGSPIAGPLTNSGTSVSNGLFTTTVDFGSEIFDGSERWLEISVRSNGIGTFSTLAPRQPITATPYAIRAARADAVGLSGVYTEPVTFDNPSNSYSGTFYGSFLGLSFIGGSFAGSFIGNGSALANLNGSQISSGSIPSAALNNSWRTIGNAGTTPGTHFIGNTDNQPLEFRINNQRVLHIGTNANGAPNLVAGSPANNITNSVEGSTIAGGGLGLYPNTITASYATIGGGTFHIVNGNWSTIAGGRDNIVQAEHSTVGGGHGNIIRPSFGYGSILGGAFNTLNTNAYYSAIGGGYANRVAVESYAATIAGGLQNEIAVSSGYGTIGGGFDNHVGTGSLAATIAGGFSNDIDTNNFGSTIGGGYGNLIALGAAVAAIAGGAENAIGTNSSYSAIGGGANNQIGEAATSATIIGGQNNRLGNNADFSTIAGGTNNQIASATRASIGGGYDNSIGNNNSGSVIAGGNRNFIGPNSTHTGIGGGSQNHVASNGVATIGGGFFNQVGGPERLTTASLFPSQGNTIAGGAGNQIVEGTRGAYIGGGNNNTVLTNGDYAMIPGGELNAATTYAFAAGRYAKANHQGAFVWGDSTPANLPSISANSVTMRASGGYRLFSDSTATAGVSLAPGATSWGVLSDRNAKKDLASVDSRAILEKLAALPITQWHYRWEAESATPHIGPMAQDFKAAFYPGREDRSITTQEADGVALAAIQGLNQKLTEELKRRDAENAELKERLQRLEQLVNQQTPGNR